MIFKFKIIFKFLKMSLKEIFLFKKRFTNSSLIETNAVSNNVQWLGYFFKISIKIHPKSYIHSIIKFRNGLIKICAHEPNMIIPIANSLDKNFHYKSKNVVNFNILNNLKFTDVDINKFPVIKILKKYPNYCTLFDTALVSVNDELVNLFLKKKISFNDIFKNLIIILNLKSIKQLKNKIPKTYKEISEINDFVRLKTLKLSVC